MRQARAFRIAGLADGDYVWPGLRPRFFGDFGGGGNSRCLHDLLRCTMKDVGRRKALPKSFPSDLVLVNQIQQVFWLSDRPSQTPSQRGVPHQWLARRLVCDRLVSDVPDYSGGTAAEFHRVPGYWMSID